MKPDLKLLLFILLVSLLTACGANATPTAEIDPSGAYTAAAATISAQSSLGTPTTSPTILAAATQLSFSTFPAIMTQQSLIAYSAASTANGCNNGIFVSDVTIPDGTILTPGESFTKTWEFQNTGSCDWTEGYLIMFVRGTNMDGDDIEIGDIVSTGSSGEISVSLLAPDSEGTYTGYWRLADEDGNLFGQAVYVQIVVSEDSSTLTPTVTPTSTPTPVPTSTSTDIPTVTPTVGG